MTEQSGEFREWAILELMGHRKMVGWITEQQIGGASFIRIDIPKGGGPLFDTDATQFYSPSAVYCITPTTEEVARKVASTCQTRPVTLAIPYSPEEEEF